MIPITIGEKKYDVREAVTQDDRNAGLRTRLVIGDLDPVHLRPLDGRHHRVERGHFGLPSASQNH